MLFNSFEFAIFFPVVTALYFLLPVRLRWLMLLIASCVFYMYFIPVYILILMFTILVDYVAGILIENAVRPQRAIYLGISIIANVGCLALFKYFNFLNGNLESLAKLIGWNYSVDNLALILPIGLSFHTFQAMSYTIEVYRGNFRAERHLGIYGLYVMFYPQLVAGPIERPQHLLPALKQRHEFDYARIVSGLKQMAWGLFKKVVIADRLAKLVDVVYANPTGDQGPALALATVFFAYQIYCDFSGYSDIAIGAARILGINLMQNFRSPYHARSVGEFWRRWHISLSTWFKDYLYIPLGGNRVSPLRHHGNLMAVFLVSGLWHGANWTYVIWGGLHGIYMVVSILTQGIRPKVNAWLGLDRCPAARAALQIVATFCLVNIAWIFFRANSVSDAYYILSNLHQGWGVFWNREQLWDMHVSLGFSRSEYLVAISAIVVLEIVDTLESRCSIWDFLMAQPRWLAWAAYYGLVCAIIVFGIFQKSQFIYFQF